MKRLFNLAVLEDNRIKASPSDYLKALPPDQQTTAVTEFLDWAENEARNNKDPQARAEAEIGIATAREFLQKLDDGAVQIYTGIKNNSDS